MHEQTEIFLRLSTREDVPPLVLLIWLAPLVYHIYCEYNSHMRGNVHSLLYKIK